MVTVIRIQYSLQALVTAIPVVRPFSLFGACVDFPLRFVIREWALRGVERLLAWNWVCCTTMQGKACTGPIKCKDESKR